ncbi:uncharacterized protein BX664DRAFT_339387 [Halteromyces radiatus]|uniref:uncharacterized protein n=1 Tax=Halteromyces radiatus TaxID=101107 RepID=UPI00221EBEF7|nr:uncharacterized protein BX664DRAFT_339387 [Halteromyces radiatus]KAI8082906.1 hypothetical protein BX664DRAFT_339387 [Halteromyces radiatus]
MGGYLSKEKTDPNDFEKVLSELDGKIQKAEIRLSDIKVRQRRTGVLVVTYSTLVWLVYVAYCFLTLHQHDSSFDMMATQVAFILVIPIGIYYLRKVLVWFYARKQTSEESNLSSLRAQQKLKVEELKKKTSYYTTQSLLERYDAEAQEKRKQLEQQEQRRQQQLKQQQEQQQHQKQQQQQLQQRKPVSMPGPRMMQAHQGNQQPNNVHPNNGPSTNPMVQPLQAYQKEPIQESKSWIDRLVDALLGADGPETKYALICNHCFTHNGLILPDEVETIQYTCPICHQFNPSRQARKLHPDGPVLPPQTPSPSMAQHKEDIGKKELDVNSEQSQLDVEKEQNMDNDDSIANRVRRRRGYSPANNDKDNNIDNDTSDNNIDDDNTNDDNENKKSL